MTLSLTTVVDETTAVNAASVNQYKTAIENLAGAGWDDAGGDLDVEELSDAVKTPGDGLDYSGGNLVVDASDFAGTGLEDDGSNNLRIAAAAAGDGLQGGAGSALAVDVSDFAGTGLEDDGSENLRIAAAAAGDGLQGGAGSALAVDVSDFAGTGLEDDGSENLRIAAAAAGNGLTGGGGSALAVNVDDSTIEINTDVVRVKALGITGSHLATGAVSAQAKVDLSDAAAANGDAIRYQEFLVEHLATGVHTPNGLAQVVYCDSSAGGSSGSAAAALTEYDYDDPGTAEAEIKIRFALLIPMAIYTDLIVHCEAKRGSTGYTCGVVVDVGGLSASQVVSATVWTETTVRLDVSTLNDGEVYECMISLYWVSELPASGDTVYMRYPAVRLAGAA